MSHEYPDGTRADEEAQARPRRPAAQNKQEHLALQKRIDDMHATLRHQQTSLDCAWARLFADDQWREEHPGRMPEAGDFVVSPGGMWISMLTRQLHPDGSWTATWGDA